MDKITVKEIYNNLVQLVIHAESVIWDRFNSYIVGNSILTLAWVTIFESNIKLKFLLVLICIFGIIASVVFAILGYRGKAFLNRYLEVGSFIEADPQCWPGELNQKYKPLTETKSFRDNLNIPWCGGRSVVVFGPIIFVIFYISLLFIALKG